jgi:hypothetical protein
VDWKTPHLRRGSIERVRDVLGSEVEVAARAWIVGRPWFKRVWILQELVLSQDPWIQCGTSATRWTCLYSHVSDISLKRLLKPEERIVNSMGRLHRQYRSPELAKNETPRFAERLYDLLKSRKGFGVTDPRDMLFANLGLVGPANEREKKLLHLIMVDYQKNEAKVYSDLARYFLESFDDFRIFALLDPNEKRCESEAPSWAPDWVCGPPSQYSRLSDELKYRYNTGYFLSFWMSQSRVLVCGGRFQGGVQALGPIIDQSLCPQIARDFSELLQRDRVLGRDLCQFMTSAFEQTYQKWRHWLVPWIPDPKRILKWIQEPFANEEAREETWLMRGVTADWPPIDSEMDDQEILIGQDIRSTLLVLTNINRIRLSDAAKNIQHLTKEPWSWNGKIHPRDEHTSRRIQSLMAQLVFSSFITDGPNLFYSRRIARLGNNLLALVPGSTRIGDIVSLPIKDNTVPLVLRHSLTQIDGDLDVEIRQRIDEGPREDLPRATRANLDQLRGTEVIEHLTIVGECFVEGRMHRPIDTKRDMGPMQILALH